MSSIEGSSANWLEGDLSESTADPNVSVMDQEVPTLAATTILGVTIVIVIAIVGVFVLGVLIDWRQQRVLNRKLVEVKRMKNQRRKNPDADVVSIANNMEEPSMSAPPAESLRYIP